jgi:hypothetical protein
MSVQRTHTNPTTIHPVSRQIGLLSALKGALPRIILKSASWGHGPRPGFSDDRFLQLDQSAGKAIRLT